MEESKFRRYLIFSALIVMAVSAPVICLGATPPTAQAGHIDPLPASNTGSLTAGACEEKMENADFRASFDWTNGDGKTVSMEIRVGKNAAQIYELTKAPKCVAVCSLKSPVDRKMASLAFPAAIDMDCQAAGFNGLATPAALVFQTRGQSVLRFGNWVSGYRDATLAIGTDHLSDKLGS